jgi:hypothetical protein
MEKNFVTFLSPGTLVSESTEKPISSWDAELAMFMAHDIVERRGATPYAFYFTKRERRDDELDSKVVATSGLYHLGGELLTLEDVLRRFPKEKFLADNMRNNNIGQVVLNENSYRSFHVFNDGDVLLAWKKREEACLSP